MDESFWLKQGEQPLWPELEWSRPQQKRSAKRLAIIGGHGQGFDGVGRLYQAAVQAGIGEAKAVLPNELKRSVGHNSQDTVFTDLTPDPEQSQAAKAGLAAFSDWADGVALVQTGNNSKTALLFNDWLSTYDGPLILGDDAVELLKHDLKLYQQRPNTLYVLSFSGLQQLAGAVKSQVGLRHDMGLRPLVLALKQLGEDLPAALCIVYEQTVVNYWQARAVTTKRAHTPDPIMLAGWSATWWLQQPGKTLEALATASHDF